MLRLSTVRQLVHRGRTLSLALVVAVGLVTAGCRPEPDIIQYEIDTRQPPQLETEQRMLAAIVPQSDAAWFFKLVGPAEDVQPLADELRQWVAGVEFSGGEPVLELPEQWTRRDGGAMRFATIEIPTDGDLPLEMSISKLARSDDWRELAAMNVNRWRGQMGLEPSEEPLAGAEPLAAGAEADDAPAVWVDLSGTFGGGPSMPPFAGGAPFAGGSGMPGGAPFAGGMPPAGGTPPPNGGASPNGGTPSSGEAGADAGAGAGQTAGGPLTYDVPEGWRPGTMSAMRWAAFSVGPEDRAAELTVIPAGGDVRGNVERWLGQIRPDGVDEALLDTVIEEAQEVTVDGRTAERFLLPGSGENPLAIDATIVPLDAGSSLFIKLTGDAETVAEHADEVGQFLESLQLNR